MTAPAASPDLPAAAVEASRIGFLGPQGTFTEQALRTQPDLAALEQVPLPTIPDVFAAVTAGEVDLGFVPVENAIEGSVTVTLDLLSFETDLLVQREVVLPVELNLIGVPGAALDGIKTVMSFPHATAQCRGFLAERLPGVATQATNSTSDASRLLAESGDPTVAAIGTARAAELYGLELLATDIADHPENATRFVVVATEGVPAATGHDKTSIVVFQRADAPGSLLAILQEFAARNVNLSKLESRPAKTGLGDYCFLIDLEGHVDDEIVADALRELKSKQADVKFLGSFPAAGEHGEEIRRDADMAWRAADEWVQGLRAQIRD